MARTGHDYLTRLREQGPEVWVGAERVRDVTSHPALGPAAKEIARLYDLQMEPANREFMLFQVDGSGQWASTQFLVPRSQDDLERRRRMHELWARATYGLMGRTTDFIGAMVTAWYISADYFEPFTENVRKWYRTVRDEDLFVTHALISPPIDRSRPPSQWPEPYLDLGVVRETDKGLIVRGAKGIATAAAYADEILVWPYVPQGFSEPDRPYAVAFSLPTSTPGLRFICREPYGGGSPADHPLASRFDEMDCVAIFDDVLVPWERVFINQDIAKANGLTGGLGAGIGRGVFAFTAFQTAIRLQVKLEFVLGVVKKATEAVKRVPPFIQHMVGEVATYVYIIEACIKAAQLTAVPNEDGVLIPNGKYLSITRVWGPWWYPRAKELLQLALSTGLIYLPARQDAFRSPIGESIRRYFRGAEITAEERVKLFRLAADLAVSAFGARHELYERFYAGDPFLLMARMADSYDWPVSLAMVEDALARTDAL
jgi:4-hydroxyphenylacetate 3-monooxygenase oxygenase component